MNKTEQDNGEIISIPRLKELVENDLKIMRKGYEDYGRELNYAYECCTQEESVIVENEKAVVCGTVTVCDGHRTCIVTSAFKGEQAGILKQQLHDKDLHVMEMLVSDMQTIMHVVNANLSQARLTLYPCGAYVSELCFYRVKDKNNPGMWLRGLKAFTEKGKYMGLLVEDESGSRILLCPEGDLELVS